MSPEQAAIIDALMMQGGGSPQSAYSAPQAPPPPPETWLEKFQREKREFQDARIRAVQEGL